MLTRPGGGSVLFVVGVGCTGSSMVLVLPLGRELLCGLCASLTRAGTSAELSVAELIELR
jgi:hypothetical protein